MFLKHINLDEAFLLYMQPIFSCLCNINAVFSNFSSDSVAKETLNFKCTGIIIVHRGT